VRRPRAHALIWALSHGGRGDVISHHAVLSSPCDRWRRAHALASCTVQRNTRHALRGRSTTLS
jgi:hypothetical protein